MGAGFNALAQAGIEERLRKADEERRAELANIDNAGLTPEAQEDAIRTLYARNPSAAKQHVENLLGRLVGQKPKPVQTMAYAPQSTTTQPAPPDLRGDFPRIVKRAQAQGIKVSPALIYAFAGLAPRRQEQNATDAWAQTGPR